jgi:hypothetical protein
MSHLLKDNLKLMHERDNFLCQPKTLLADIVLLSYINDVLESVQAAMGIIALETIPHRAFALVRTSFEAAQQGMVLVTQDNYALIGAKAWVYYCNRDKEWLLKAKPDGSGINNNNDANVWFENKLQDIAKLWDSYSAGQGKLVEQARVELKHAELEKQRHQRHKPDNWLGENMLHAQDEAYRKIASRLNIPFDKGLSDINRNIYGALSRSTHTGLIINTDVAFENYPNGIKTTISARDNEFNFKTAIATAEQSVFEILLALDYRKHLSFQ